MSSKMADTIDRQILFNKSSGIWCMTKSITMASEEIVIANNYNNKLSSYV